MTRYRRGQFTTYGAEHGLPSGPIIALIGEPTLYNRALTIEEVKSIYAAGSAGKMEISVTTVDPTRSSDNSGVIKANVLGGASPFTYALGNGDFQPDRVFIASGGDAQPVDHFNALRR